MEEAGFEMNRGKKPHQVKIGERRLEIDNSGGRKLEIGNNLGRLELEMTGGRNMEKSHLPT